MGLKERRELVKAMWNTGLTRPEIAAELGLTYSQVDHDIQVQGLCQHHRGYRIRGIPAADLMTMADVEYYKLSHPPGTTVQDEDGKKYIVIKAYADICEVEVSKNYKTCLRWQELARVDWNLKRGRNPKMEDSNEDDNKESESSTGS